MSQQEFDQADAQVIGIVEGHAHPDAKKAVRKICEDREGDGDQKVVGTYRDVLGDQPVMVVGGTSAAELRRGILLTAIQVLSCILVAALFVAALMDTSFVVFLANVGVLVCGMVAAVKIDRAIRTWRKR